MDGSAAFAGLLLYVLVPYYKLPVENANGEVDVSCFLINLSVELSVLVGLTKFFASFFVLTESRKGVVERFHKFVMVVSFLSSVTAFVLEKTGWSLFSKVPYVTVINALLLSLVPGVIFFKGFGWIGNGMWKGICEFTRAHPFCAKSMVIVILAAISAFMFKLGREGDGTTTF